jgi:hypothetical protein
VPRRKAATTHALALWRHTQLPIKPDLNNAVWQVLSALGHVSGYWHCLPDTPPDDKESVSLIQERRFSWQHILVGCDAV